MSAGDVNDLREAIIERLDAAGEGLSRDDWRALLAGVSYDVEARLYSEPAGPARGTRLRP